MNDPITTLELDQILKRAAAFASSEPGRQRIRSLVPSGDFAEVRNRLDLTAEAEKLYEYFKSLMKKELSHVGEGIFGAHMEVSLVNDGPVTIIMDSDVLTKKPIQT